MTPADRRISELLDKWLTSVELHLQYVELSDAAYARAQAWPKHDRPTRWVLEVARQKLLELKGHCETRQAMGDGRFSESLELMAFLANLIGVQHIERFVPLADPNYTPPTSTTTTVEAPAIAKAPAARPRPPVDESTREMPRLKTPPAAARAATPPPAAPAARGDGKAPARTATQAKTAPPPPQQAKSTTKSTVGDMKGKIIADAIRLLKWGKSWHELAELIARIAERPPESDVRKVLRAHKSEIEAQAAEEG
jgi:hypothetical protein